VQNSFEIHSSNGNDLILNFHASSDKIILDSGVNGSDIIDATSLFSHMTTVGSNVTFDLGLGNSITLVGVDVSSLMTSDFVFI